jgi:hypothetical protein
VIAPRETWVPACAGTTVTVTLLEAAVSLETVAPAQAGAQYLHA